MFSCRGRPFTSMISKTVPTPTSTLIDYEVVKDLQIKMTDLQCKRYTFAGFKMQILGQICTAVQCNKDGFVSGTFQLTATVVLDLGPCQTFGYIQRGRQEVGKLIVSSNHLNTFSITQDSRQNISAFNYSKSITISSSQNIGISSSTKSNNISLSRQNIA